MFKTKLEDYRQGYPRLAAFLSLDNNFRVFKKFDYLHMRSLLDQQDELSELEARLNHCDDADSIQLGLSSRRQDANNERRAILKELRPKLKAYDEAVHDYITMLRLPEASSKDRESVENWLLGNKPLVRSESHVFLNMSTVEDFVSLTSTPDDRAGLEMLLDFAAKTFPGIFKRFSSNPSKTIDSHIFVFPPRLLDRVARAFMALFLPIWLIFPVILLFHIPSPVTRAVIYCVFTTSTSFIVIFTTNTTKYDLILALITYATLLGAFLADSPTTVI